MAKKKKEEKPEPKLDQDGIVIHEYPYTVLVVVPPTGFGEQGVSFARSQLASVRVATVVASSNYDEVLKGRLQEFFLPDLALDDAKAEDYSGILIASAENDDLAEDQRVLQLVREMASEGKLVGTMGNGLEVLIRAGVLKGKRVTGDKKCEQAAKKAGAKYTGRQVEASGNVVTALGECAGVRFGRALVDTIVRQHAKAS
jgi:putative intracellular protease/amidase